MYIHYCACVRHPVIIIAYYTVDLAFCLSISSSDSDCSLLNCTLCVAIPPMRRFSAKPKCNCSVRDPWGSHHSVRHCKIGITYNNVFSMEVPRSTCKFTKTVSSATILATTHHCGYVATEAHFCQRIHRRARQRRRRSRHRHSTVPPHSGSRYRIGLV